MVRVSDSMINFIALTCNYVNIINFIRLLKLIDFILHRVSAIHRRWSFILKVFRFIFI